MFSFHKSLFLLPNWHKGDLSLNFKIFDICFLGITITLFYVLRTDFRKYILLIASLFYCYHINHASVVYLYILSITVYTVGIAIDKCNNLIFRKFILGSFLLVLLVQFLFIKDRIPLFSAPFLAIGVSFYTFQMISYLVDIYKSEIRPEKDFLILLLSFAWFPKLVSGPVEKTQRITSQIRVVESYKVFEKDNFYTCVVYILYGFFCKLVLADRLAIYVDSIWEQPEIYGSLYLVLGSFLYTLQIYFDFSGYSNIAIGVSKLFGIELIQNFNVPYLAENISDFWKRWHISLSTWLKNYIYIPLGGGRCGQYRKYLNLLILFIICGFWHGKGFNFVIWGLLHAIYSIANDYFAKKDLGFFYKGWSGRIITFIEVSFAWIFFRASSSKGAFKYILGSLGFSTTTLSSIEQYQLIAFDSTELFVIIIGLIITIIIEANAYRKKLVPVESILRYNEVLKAVIIYVLTLSIFIFGVYGSDEFSNFIYMQF